MKNRAVISAVATALVVGLVIAGLVAVGSPATARKYKFDQERRNRISQLNYVLASYIREEGELPRSLEAISQQQMAQSGYGSDLRRDPRTGEPFEYRRLSDREYEVCATFETSSRDRRSQEFGGYPNDVAHKAGRSCFEREISDQEVESAVGMGIGEPPFPRALPPKLTPSETVRPDQPQPPPAPSDPSTRSASPEPTVSPAAEASPV